MSEEKKDMSEEKKVGNLGKGIKYLRDSITEGMNATDSEKLYYGLKMTRKAFGGQERDPKDTKVRLYNGDLNIHDYISRAFDRLIYKYPKLRNDLHLLYSVILHDLDASSIAIFNDMSNKFRPDLMHDLDVLFTNVLKIIDEKQTSKLINRIKGVQEKLSRTKEVIHEEFKRRIEELNEEHREAVESYRDELAKSEETMFHNNREFENMQRELKRWQKIVDKMKRMHKFFKDHKNITPNAVMEALRKKEEARLKKEKEEYEASVKLHKLLANMDDEERLEHFAQNNPKEKEVFRLAREVHRKRTLNRQRSLSPQAVRQKIREEMRLKESSACLSAAMTTRSNFHSKTRSLFK